MNVVERGFEAAVDAVGELVHHLFAAGLLHAADGFDFVGLIALALGEFDDQVVAEDAAGRHVAALGFGLPPLPQLADDRQAAAGEVADARDFPPPRPVARLAQLAVARWPFLRRTIRRVCTS